MDLFCEVVTAPFICTSTRATMSTIAATNASSYTSTQGLRQSQLSTARQPKRGGRGRYDRQSFTVNVKLVKPGTNSVNPNHIARENRLSESSGLSWSKKLKLSLDMTPGKMKEEIRSSFSQLTGNFELMRSNQCLRLILLPPHIDCPAKLKQFPYFKRSALYVRPLSDSDISYESFSSTAAAETSTLTSGTVSVARPSSAAIHNVLSPSLQRLTPLHHEVQLESDESVADADQSSVTGIENETDSLSTADDCKEELNDRYTETPSPSEAVSRSTRGLERKPVEENAIDKSLSTSLEKYFDARTEAMKSQQRPTITSEMAESQRSDADDDDRAFVVLVERRLRAFKNKSIKRSVQKSIMDAIFDGEEKDEKLEEQVKQLEEKKRIEQIHRRHEKRGHVKETRT